ncbi:protein TESPA1 [Rhinopithecus roxellana]|uniref:Thymocyte expressed, positive selection associated 1 n=2 Tax=Rhinopithecus bieti TaxID=61621 RepID=A0A2K6M6U9_RHIBE|nr:protein TESPA1 [Rhinopithecus roxellana]XP_017712852.1 PREDICTED: protein TESPA1 isoform X1 [Rhinopithecus bieti]XP_017712853.1 PREDICTED: protein TESPA1 isoform X1 [Rhinopithecus bieti]XP_030794811.1 protein TESPA1 [Rhinopithecus roxellana]
MEASVLSPTSWEKRRAWLRQSRNWQTQVLEEEAAAALQDVPDPEPSSLDDVFQEGNPINKIEDWLQDCGYSEEGLSEEAGQFIYNGFCSHGTSFEDDLTLGAEATLLAANGKLFSRSFLETARPCQLLDLGCSLASSSMTAGTNRTSSSISEILDKVQEDAEDVLFSLGFGQEDHKDTSRIPARFFTTPSQAKGIDFQLFLKSQVRRIEMEDPCLMLASRFKQVQTLAVTADAFFCLYSYVSKTPVQKFTPSHMFWNCNHPTDVPSIRILSREPEPHSPRDRLRKAISKMCLYTCPRDRPPPPHNTPKNGLDQVVLEAVDKVKEEKQVLQQDSDLGQFSQEDPVPPVEGEKLPTSPYPCVLCCKEETQQGMSTVLAPSQTLDSNPKVPCCTHFLPTEDPQWSTNPAHIRRELCSLPATNTETHPAKDETFWKRKSTARKSLFQKNLMGRKVKSLDLSITQQKWKQSVDRPELHRSSSQQPQDTFDLEEVQSNSEEEESQSRWPSRRRHQPHHQTFAGKDS